MVLLLFYSRCSVNNEGHESAHVICDVCGHRYISENDLNVHMQSLHSGYNNLSSITSSSCKINPESANKNVDSLEDSCDLIVLTEPSHAGIQASLRHSFVFLSSRAKVQDRARKVIYDFIGRRQETQHMLKDAPKLEYHGGSQYESRNVPDLPY